ncbi:Protein of unknown function [Pyronema omphalodes CBS 100304]|uniref:Uncharacterized protein n=1 Tax=Pyronema omphalodes (strain CBS 100304) TaxID=1076935 RepID=U4LQF4_PYROM|nr:Protein of unknown function [Pyronema omphalodes CBS 100304]
MIYLMFDLFTIGCIKPLKGSI